MSKLDSNAPRVATTVQQLRDWVAAARGRGERIGLVPTMGALHRGHLSLAEQSIRDGFQTIVTIFVNPTQFGPHEDFQRYPRNLAADLELLKPLNVGAVFAPSVDEMYPAGYDVAVQVGGVTETLEGALRPGHFAGVATVVLKLFNIAGADVAYFGQKDYQQTLVVRKMVRDLDVPIEVRVAPTVRDADGLALSSRNAYLSPQERQQALVISRSLNAVRQAAESGERSAARLQAVLQEHLAAEAGFVPQYAVVVDGSTLAPIETIERTAVAAAAGFVGRTRLIDNILIEPQR